MRLGGFTLCVALSVGVGNMVLSSRASAQDAQASYTVVTNDGSTYQGQLVENVVGQHVTIKLLSGELRTFQASDVRSQGPAGSVSVIAPTVVPSVVAQEQVALQTLSQLQAGTPGAPPVTYNGPDAVQIHITKANNTEGTLLMESQSGWVPVCTMPCSTSVDPKIDYRLHNTDTFRFPAGPPLDLVVDGGGRRVFRGIGWALIGLSLAATIVGSLVWADVFSGNPTAVTGPEMTAQKQTENSNMIAGITIVGVSAATLTVGIVFCALRPSATLTSSTGVRLVKQGIPLGHSTALTIHGLVF
jgi:hypothetical protein